MEGQCFLAQRDNVDYVTHTRDLKNPYAMSEVIISLRNDCFEDYCCQNEKECTKHTSGQLTSKHTYGYGHFYFLLRISKETDEYKIESMSFKSVFCASNPSSRHFPYVLKASSAFGYCENKDADLFQYSSNRDLCSNGASANICGRYTWVIDNYSPAVFNFKSHGKDIDYETAAIFVNGKFIAEGNRNLLQDFDIILEKHKRHIIQVYGWENCCSGRHSDGYFGWNLKRVPDSYTGIDDRPPQAHFQKHSVASSSGSAANEAGTSDSHEVLPSNLEESSSNKEDVLSASTSHPMNTTSGTRPRHSRRHSFAGPSSNAEINIGTSGTTDSHGGFLSILESSSSNDTDAMSASASQPMNTILSRAPNNLEAGSSNDEASTNQQMNTTFPLTADMLSTPGPVRSDSSDSASTYNTFIQCSTSTDGYQSPPCTEDSSGLDFDENLPSPASNSAIPSIPIEIQIGDSLSNSGEDFNTPSESEEEYVPSPPSSLDNNDDTPRASHIASDYLTDGSDRSLETPPGLMDSDSDTGSAFKGDVHLGEKPPGFANHIHPSMSPTVRQTTTQKASGIDCSTCMDNDPSGSSVSSSSGNSRLVRCQLHCLGGSSLGLDIYVRANEKASPGTGPTRKGQKEQRKVHFHIPEEENEVFRAEEEVEVDEDDEEYEDQLLRALELSREGLVWGDRYTTESIYTTGESTSSTEDAIVHSETSIESGTDATGCFNLQTIVKGFHQNVILKIAMCFSTLDPKQCMLIVKHENGMYKEVVELPFDASKRTGQYSIDYLPDKIVWKVNQKKLGEVQHSDIQINDPLRIKIYAAPNDPLHQMTRLEHVQMHLQAAGYRKYLPEKEELFIIGENIDTPRRIFIILLSVVILSFLYCLYFWTRKSDIPEGYTALQQGEP